MLGFEITRTVIFSSMNLRWSAPSAFLVRFVKKTFRWRMTIFVLGVAMDEFWINRQWRLNGYCMTCGAKPRTTTSVLCPRCTKHYDPSPFRARFNKDEYGAGTPRAMAWQRIVRENPDAPIDATAGDTFFTWAAEAYVKVADKVGRICPRCEERYLIEGAWTDYLCPSCRYGC